MGVAAHCTPWAAFIALLLCTSTAGAAQLARIELQNPRTGEVTDLAAGTNASTHLGLLNYQDVRAPLLRRCSRLMIGAPSPQTTYIGQVSLGTPAQTFNVIFDTGSCVPRATAHIASRRVWLILTPAPARSDLWVPAHSCESCQRHNKCGRVLRAPSAPPPARLTPHLSPRSAAQVRFLRFEDVRVHGSPL